MDSVIHGSQLVQQQLLCTWGAPAGSGRLQNANEKEAARCVLEGVVRIHWLQPGTSASRPSSSLVLSPVLASTSIS